LYTSPNSCYSDQIKEDELGWACGTCLQQLSLCLTGGRFGREEGMQRYTLEGLKKLKDISVCFMEVAGVAIKIDSASAIASYLIIVQLIS